MSRTRRLMLLALFGTAVVSPVGCTLFCFPVMPPPADSFVGPTPPGAEPKPPARPPEAPPKPPVPAEPLELGVGAAILMAVGNNPSLQVERYNPPITRTYEDEQRAAFDPTLSASLTRNRSRTERRSPYGGGTTSSVAEDTSADVELAQTLPTGTAVALSGSTDLSSSSLYSDRFATSRGGLTITQALLRGFGCAVNLASLRQARLDTLTSQYELRGFAQDLVASVEETYWDYALAHRQIEIYAASLKLAEQQLAETDERIRLGQLAETERAAAQAEVALRREALINARSRLATTRLILLRLVNPAGAWSREVTLKDAPAVPEAALDGVEAHVEVALRMRPEINEARLRVLRGDLELVRTRNGLLPQLDLFVTLGKSGYAESFSSSVRQVHEGRAYDWQAGLSLEVPLGNRAPRARHERATLTRRQSLEAIGNLVQLVQFDVRSAYIEVGRAKEQVVATAATRAFKEEALRAETAKFGVGRSTSFLVAQAQRDLVESQIGEVEAVVSLLKGIVELYRLEGSLLERRGIDAPGRQPVAEAQ